MIRKARKEDCPALYSLLLEIFYDMELEIFNFLPPEDLRKMVVESMEEEKYRYSYRNGIVYEENGEIQGCCFGYRGQLELQLNIPLQQRLAAYGLDPSVPFFPDEETFPGEWYLDSLVTKKSCRGKGVAGKLLAALPEVARQEQETVIGLNCDQGNPRARSLYEKAGFRKTSEMTLSGHLYDHMQKTVE